MTRLRLKELPRYDCLREAAQTFPQLDPTSMETFLMLLRMGHLIEERGTTFFARHNISQARFLILMLLMRGSSGESCVSTPAELADMTCCTRATMTGLIDTLERDGMVRREPDPKDRRMMKVSITESGVACMHRILPEHFERITQMMSPLSEAECRTLVGLLAKLLGANGPLEEGKSCPKNQT